MSVGELLDEKFPEITRCNDAWDQLSTHLKTHFNEPDLDALRAVLAVAHSHYDEGDPVWAFVIGASGSGKTSICINAISQWPKVIIMSDITPKAFLPGGKDGYTVGILETMGKSGILAFKDFTTILSQREDDRRVISSQLREIWDGSFSRNSGARRADWQGKVTVIAAVTPAIERSWSVGRELGERFMQIRWNSPRDSVKTARMAAEQKGSETEIYCRTKKLCADLFKASAPAKSKSPYFTKALKSRIHHLSVAIAQLRTHVIRDTHGKREIIDLTSTEEPTRISKSLSTIACHHALLFRKDGVDENDLLVSTKVGVDSIPLTRSKVIHSIPLNAKIDLTTICHFTGMPRSTVLWHLEELTALKVLNGISSRFSDSIDNYEFTEEFLSHWKPI
jgi:hypothetical protein